MPFENRAAPVGSVSKYYVGAWTEPGIGGLVTPIFPVAVPWEHSNTDALSGPAIHWNTYLKCYVVVLNHTCCKPEWPQEGIYLSITTDLQRSGPGVRPSESWMPGTSIFRPPSIRRCRHRPGETDTLAGKYARLYIKGISNWDIEFFGADEPGGLPILPGPPDPPEDPPDRDRLNIGGVSGMTAMRQLSRIH